MYPRNMPTGVRAAATMYTGGRPEGLWMPFVSAMLSSVSRFSKRERENRKSSRPQVDEYCPMKYFLAVSFPKLLELQLDTGNSIPQHVTPTPAADQCLYHYCPPFMPAIFGCTSFVGCWWNSESPEMKK